LTLAVIKLLIWQAQRQAWESIVFPLAGVATAAMAFAELSMLRAEAPEQYATAMRWFHVAVWWVVVTLVAFVRLRLRAGLPWLAWGVVILRTCALLLNFLVGQNITYLEITDLRSMAFLGESVASPVGVPNPWMLVAQLGNLTFIAFVVEATIAVWRRGESREVLIEAASIVLFGVLGSAHAALVAWQIVAWPVMTSFFFKPIVVAMRYRMCRNLLRAARLAEELHESEDRMALAAEAAGVGVFTWSVGGGDEVWGSARWRQLFDFPASASVCLEDVLQRIHADDRKEVRRAMQDALGEQHRFAGEYRVQAPNGTQRWIATQGRVYPGSNGMPARMLGVVVDVTGRKEAEQELTRQREKLASLSRVTMLSVLSGALAHELNQPLTAILSNAQAALRFLKHDHPDLDEVREIVADIVAEDKRAGEIIRSLRMLFRTGAVQYQPLDVNDVIHEVLKLARSDLENQGVVMQTQLGANLPILQGDRVELQRVLLNLVMNACDAMTEMPRDTCKLTIRTELAEGDNVHVSVSDSGTGIAPGMLEQVFDAFFTSKEHGLGLGLAVCRTIVTAHGGRLWASNNLTTGATFHFVLPAWKG